MKTILAPVDFSPVSQPVLAAALALARSTRARLVLLHVVALPAVADSEFGSQISADYATASLAAAARDLAAIKTALRPRGLVVVTRQLLGFPGLCILEEAERLDANYIVLGSHGHGAFYDLIVGGTTSRVLRRARCPVVVVPAAHPRSRAIAAPARAGRRRQAPRAVAG
jgi:nucleotide-binding universal stress UspA family protein